MNPVELLKTTRVEVAPETFNLVSLRREDWLKLLENPELSPRMSAPFMIFSDKWEVTLPETFNLGALYRADASKLL